MMDNTEMEVGTLSGSSSIGEAVSGRGQNAANDDDDDDGEDLYYIPERRPSLDLGPNLMDVGEGYRFLFTISHLKYIFWVILVS